MTGIYMKRQSKLIIIKKMQIKTGVRHHFISVRVTII